jgi:hypothetical protein
VIDAGTLRFEVTKAEASWGTYFQDLMRPKFGGDFKRCAGEDHQWWLKTGPAKARDRSDEDHKAGSGLSGHNRERLQHAQHVGMV